MPLMVCMKFLQQLTRIVALFANSLQQVEVDFEQLFRVLLDLQPLQLFVPRAHSHVLAVRGECGFDRLQHSFSLRRLVTLNGILSLLELRHACNILPL